jgi:DNA-directed RNA polymerase specialized sigma24 family protein
MLNLTPGRQAIKTLGGLALNSEGSVMEFIPIDFVAQVRPWEEEPSGREALVQAVFRRLDETERLPLLLYSLGGHSVEGVAGFLDWPVETVRERVRQAQQRLQEELHRLVEEAFPPRDALL